MPDRRRPLSPPYLYPGGSRRHADFVLAHLPEYFGSYFEPFLGGGAVAIAVMELFPSVSFQLSSDDAELVNTWQVLQTRADDLVRAVGGHRERHDRVYAERLSAFDDGRLAELSPLERAARFVYLRGGAGRDVLAFDEANVRRVGALLAERDVRLETRGFFQIVSEVAEEDLVYLDPPFRPGSPEPDVAPELPAAPAAPAAPSTLGREVRGLIGTVTARGAYLLAPDPEGGDRGPGGDRAAGAPYAAWNTMSVVSARDDDDRLWANGTLARAARRAAEQARRER